MRKIIVLQHVAHEILGTLNPLLKKEGFRVRYINFDREPEAQPSMHKYDGLIVLGGYMGVYECEKFRHLKLEMQLIEQALKKDIPILGICLGSQLLAHVLGGHVQKHTTREMGWYDVFLTEKGLVDPILNHFKREEKVFQSHGDTFTVPKSAVHLAWSELCPGQAFRFGNKVYGLQFHLEVDEPIIHRWLNIPVNLKIMENSDGAFVASQIRAETKRHIQRSMDLSHQTFMKFIEIFGPREHTIVLGSGHGKPSKPE